VPDYSSVLTNPISVSDDGSGTGQVASEPTNLAAWQGQGYCPAEARPPVPLPRLEESIADPLGRCPVGSVAVEVAIVQYPKGRVEGGIARHLETDGTGRSHAARPGIATTFPPSGCTIRSTKLASLSSASPFFTNRTERWYIFSIPGTE
jgi:hypothetical protein